MHCVIFAGGTLRPGRAVQEALNSADLIIAADSGASTALASGYIPAIIVGDFDSLDPRQLERLKGGGSQIKQVAVEKDETDSELAVQIALEQGADTITLLGGLGGARFDHTIANILLLAGFPDSAIRIVDGPSISWLLSGPASTHIEGEEGDLLSILPLTASATGIHTEGLYYPLNGEMLHFGKPRGVSNVLTRTYAEVKLESGMLLLIHTSMRELKSQE